MDSNQVISELRLVVQELDVKVDELTKESERVTSLLADDPRYGRKGLLTAVENIRQEQDRLKRLLDGYEDREQRREDEVKKTAQTLADTVKARADELKEDALAREKKRDRFFVWVFGLLGTIIAGLVVTGVGVYLNVIFGGTP